MIARGLLKPVVLGTLFALALSACAPAALPAPAAEPAAQPPSTTPEALIAGQAWRQTDPYSPLPEQATL